ncbi:MAG: CHASE2 domain-containing protein [Spirochaetaceae bacterium]|nr:CHASE2 domain-containing protein [Spirochaetaceae bacterium]
MAEKKENAKLILEKSKQMGDKIKSFLAEKLEYVIAFIVCVIISAVSLSSGFKSLEFKYYDMYLKLKAEIPQSKDIIMAFVDDDAIGEIGTYPWSRDIYADMLIRLREVGAKAAVFDIEFLDRSSMGVNPDYVSNKLPQEYSSMQKEVTSSINDFSSAIESKSLPINEAGEIGQEINDYL